MAVKGSNGAGALDTRLLREEATSITDAVARIVRITDQVSQGAETQVRSLDDALSGLNQMTTSLKETASQAESISGSTDSLVSSINEVAASIEQVTANVTGLAGFIQQTATSIQQNNASIQDVAAITQQMSSSADQVTTSMVEMTRLSEGDDGGQRCADVVGEPDRGGHRRDDPLDPGCRRQCRRARRIR